MADLSRLRALMRRLRDPETGCPWDCAQTFESIVPYTLEEAYEVCDAIECSDLQHLREELGDLLLQILFYCQMAEEGAHFSFEDVIETLEEKLIERHPHVFAEPRASSVQEVAETWESAKADGRPSSAGALDGVAEALPALVRAQKLQRRAARVGFDWPDWSGPQGKLLEELDELATAQRQNSPSAVRHEIGDVLFSAVNLARHLGEDAETALRWTNRRFEARFRTMESSCRARQQPLDSLSETEWEALWCAAKGLE